MTLFLDAHNARDGDWRSETLPLRERRLNRPHHIHAPRHATERSKALTIQVAVPTEVERRLVADADEEARRRRVGATSGHRQRTVQMTQPGDRCATAT